MIRIDMSEYMEKFSVSRLVGAPPGYVGYEEGGQLTEAVRRRPYSVLLLDEIEKAHPDVFNILLQVLDDGRLTDSQGRTVDFKNTIIIMTSRNIGSHIITAEVQKMKADNADRILAHLRDSCSWRNFEKRSRPEFLNRIDEDCDVPADLGKPIFARSSNIQTPLRVIDMTEKNGIHLEVSNDARDWLAKSGFDPIYGARPLKRVIQKAIVDPLAMKLLGGEILQGDTMRVDHNDRGQYTFERV